MRNISLLGNRKKLIRVLFVVILVVFLPLGSITAFNIYQKNTVFKDSKIVVETQTFKSYETPQFRLYVNENGVDLSLVSQANAAEETSVEAQVIAGNGSTDIKPIVQKESPGVYLISLKPVTELTPGDFKLEIKISNSIGERIISQNFSWGVLALNPNKAVYAPGETAKIAIGVLNEFGEMVCNSAVKLEILNPNNETTVLSTENGKIRTNNQCRSYEFSLEPDYEASYKLTDEGEYKLTLTAATNNGTHTIEDFIKVERGVPFDIERESATRIYPLLKYPMNITIKANQDYKGRITEKVPSSFKIEAVADSDFEISVEKADEIKTLVWNVDIKKGDVVNLKYRFDAPDLSPRFYLLGPLVIGDFEEGRHWQIASDAVANNGIWTYGDSVDNGNMNFRVFTDPSTAGSELLTQATDGTNDIGWIKVAAAPTREEMIAVHMKNTGRLDVLTCTSGCDGQADWTLRATYSTAVTDANAELTRPFDVAYEQLSGDAIVFFTDDNTTGTIYYCVWDGTNWTPTTECSGGTFAPGTGNDIDLTAASVTGQPEWIRAVPRGDRLTQYRTDEMLLAVSDSADDLWLAHWTGSAVNQAESPTTGAPNQLSATDAQKFDIAWEETTGEGMVVLTDTVDAAMRFSVYTSAGGWGDLDTTNGPTNPSTIAWNSWLELASDPSSDDIAMIGTTSSPDADAAVWTGAAWTNDTTALTDQDSGVSKDIAVSFTRFSKRATFLNVGDKDTDYDGHCWTEAGGFTALNTAVGTITTTDGASDIVTVGSPNTDKMLGSSVDIVDDLEGFIYTDATGCADGDWINSSVATAFNAAVRGAASYLPRIADWPAFKPYSPWSLNWRFYDDETSDNPSTGLNGAAENTTPTSVDKEEFIRLRINTSERGGMGQTDTRKILQYVAGSGSCTPNTVENDPDCTWTDVGDTGETSAVWRYATAGETCSACTDGNTSTTSRLTGTNESSPSVFYISDKDAATDTDFDHSANLIREIDFPLKAEDVATSTTYYFRLYEPRISSNGQASPVFREQDDDGANDCASSTCTYPSLTISVPDAGGTGVRVKGGSRLRGGSRLQ